jgi:hypothetical protein
MNIHYAVFMRLIWEYGRLKVTLLKWVLTKQVDQTFVQTKDRQQLNNEL